MLYHIVPLVVKANDLTKRAIYVYLPTVQMVRSWKKLAEKSKLSLSRFVSDHVENSLNQEQNKTGYESRTDLIKQLEEKGKQVNDLMQENKLLKRLADNLDSELAKYRARPFLEPEFSGMRKYDEELVQLLKERGTVDSDHILKELRIRPQNTDQVKSIYKQLESLESFGLIRTTPRGWQWNG